MNDQQDDLSDDLGRARLVFVRYSKMRVCDDVMVGPLTAEGWRLIKTVSDTKVEMIYEKQAHFVEPARESGQYVQLQGWQTIDIPKAFVVPTTMYLMGMPDDDALSVEQAMRAEAEQKAREAVTTQEAAVAEAAKKVTEMKKQLDQVEDVRRLLELANDAARVDKDVLRSRLHKMEEDMGKLRGAIGDRQMKEILG